MSDPTDSTRPEKTPASDTPGAGTPTGDDDVDRTGQRAGETDGPSAQAGRQAEQADATAPAGVSGDAIDPSTKVSADPAVTEATKGVHTTGTDADATTATDVTTGERTGTSGGLTPAGTPAAATPVTTRRGMFGSPAGPGDTSGYSGLVSTSTVALPAQRPYGGWFDEVADLLGDSLAEIGLGYDSPAGAIEKVVVSFGEITFHVRREHVVEVCRRLRDEPDLRFELSLGVSGVHYPEDTGRELHAVYHLKSITHSRRVRLEVSVPDADPHIPSTTAVYPTHDWHERETWDFFGIQFDGHPALTRIHMPDDWPGHPQRKDYPLGGIPVEYKGATVPSPDVRRQYT
ncbi:NADH-quinone oxidoreductase subunit C [Aquipuribacter hungaricus]|uniref:NADH-quinone oxidoreductase subunit C n=1 Tax=Aquipuribacter hungaricus TaxID=545624 RepID=A0ABV7WJ95_9MICO